MNEELKRQIDGDTQSFIRRCSMGRSLVKRVEMFWNWFVENEEKLSDLVRHRSQEDTDTFISFVHKGISLISENMNYNLGGDNEFSFSVEGWPDLFILYPYIISCMPDSLKSKWKFFPFNQGTESAFGFRMYGADIDTARIMVSASYFEKSQTFRISCYEQSLNALPDGERDNALWIILENVLGEGISFKYLDGIEPTANPADDMMPLTELRRYMKEKVEAHGRQFLESPTDMYCTYRFVPRDSDVLRYDVIAGSTCLYSIISDYYNDSTEILDHISSFGAQALFIVFPNVDDSAGNEVQNLRYDIEDRISNEILAPMNFGQVIGGATGTHYSYIDLLVFDLSVFVEMVRPLLEQYPEISFYMSEFRRQSGLTQLTEAKA